MAKILVPGVTMKDVEEARNSKPLPGNVLDDNIAETSVSNEDVSKPLPGDVLGASNFDNKECQCVKALAKKLYRPYDTVYNKVLELVPDFVKSDYPNISDYEWVCHSFMLTEDVSLMTEEEKEVAKGVERKKAEADGSNKPTPTPKSEPSTPTPTPPINKSKDSSSSINKDELKDFVSRKLDGLRKELFDYIDKL